jgi:hypothetical protein
MEWTSVRNRETQDWRYTPNHTQRALENFGFNAKQEKNGYAGHLFGSVAPSPRLKRFRKHLKTVNDLY